MKTVSTYQLGTSQVTVIVQKRERECPRERVPKYYCCHSSDAALLAGRGVTWEATMLSRYDNMITISWRMENGRISFGGRGKVRGGQLVSLLVHVSCNNTCGVEGLCCGIVRRHCGVADSDYLERVLASGCRWGRTVFSVEETGLLHPGLALRVRSFIAIRCIITLRVTLLVNHWLNYYFNSLSKPTRSCNSVFVGLHRLLLQNTFAI